MRIVLVTGATGGFGQAIARKYATNGDKVIVHYRSGEGEKLAEEIGGFAVQADLSKEEEVQKMFWEIKGRFDKIDVVINNASPKTNPLAFEETKWEDYNKFISVTVKGAQLVCKEAVPLMDGGNIISVLTSYVHNVPPAKLIPYVTAKYALQGFSKALASELAAKKIRVNMVSPSMSQTPFTAHLPEKLFELEAYKTPLKRLVTPEDVANIVFFLSSNEASFLTGVDIPITGGGVM